MATILQVAQRAGVSTTTVSSVINDTRRVSAELRQRVLDAVGALDYRPSRIARSLREGKTSTIGLIVDDITHRFAAELFKGLEQDASRKRYTILISDLRRDPGREDASIEVLLKQCVDGIVFAGFGRASDRLETLQAGGLPVVSVDKPLERPALSSVLIDNRASVHAMLGHLEELGHRRILFVNGLRINRNAKLRAQAFEEFITSRGLPSFRGQVLYGDYTLQHGFRAALRILDEGPPCTAIFCGDDTIAFGVMAALKLRGVRIPEAVAVAGFDDDPLAQAMDPPLTTVHYPAREMGRRAFRLLWTMLSAGRGHVEHIVLPTRLVVRRSTDPRCRPYEGLGCDGSAQRGSRG